MYIPPPYSASHLLNTHDVKVAEDSSLRLESVNEQFSRQVWGLVFGEREEKDGKIENDFSHIH